MLRKQAYERMQVEQWQQIRWLGFRIVEPYLKDQKTTIYDLLPLPGDPKKEDVKKSNYEYARQVYENFIKKGVIKVKE